jgi:tRNA dimethylallyltransferase
MNKLLVICGPTATGKTALAVTLAKKFNGELISADSRQVYKGMDIVTGKDRPASTRGESTRGGPDVPIWLYDVADPDEEFSVSHWVRLARAAIAGIAKRNKLPIVVGGTGLYIHALIHPFETINIPPNMRLRKKLQTMSVVELKAITMQGNMNQSDWNNPRRLIRKIEIASSKKKALQGESLKSFDYLMIGLTAPMPILYKRIDERLKKRVRQGMKEEIDILIKKYGRDLPSMTAIGVNEHAYARRQLTWFKREKGICWFDVTDRQMQDKVAARVGAWYTTDNHV